jgi:Tfp pilus assembly protein PilE
MSPIEYLKIYWRTFVAVLVIAFLISIIITTYVLRRQRDAARTALAAAQLIIKDYKAQSDAAKAHAVEVMALAESNEVADADVIAKLKAQVAASDEEARRLAIEAGKLIGGLK